MKASELKSRLSAMGVPHADCLDKESLDERYAESAIKFAAGLGSADLNT